MKEDMFENTKCILNVSECLRIQSANQTQGDTQWKNRLKPRCTLQYLNVAHGVETIGIIALFLGAVMLLFGYKCIFLMSFHIISVKQKAFIYLQQKPLCWFKLLQQESSSVLEDEFHCKQNPNMAPIQPFLTN